MSNALLAFLSLAVMVQGTAGPAPSSQPGSPTTLAFGPGPIGNPVFRTAEGAFTYGTFSGGLYRDTQGNGDPFNMEGCSLCGGGVMSVVRNDPFGARFTFDGADVAFQFNQAYSIDFEGFRGGVSQGTDSFLTTADSEYSTHVSHVLAGVPIDELRVTLDATSSSATVIDNLVVSALERPAGTLSSSEPGAAPGALDPTGPPPEPTAPNPAPQPSASATYCTPGTSASGCNARVTTSGTASATAPSGFVLSANGAEGSMDGLFLYAANGRQESSWGNGTSFQCVVPPVKRAGLLGGSGTSGACDGSFQQDLNALWCPTCPKPGHNPGAGATVQAQLWYRDPASTSNQTTSLSDAIEFVLGP